MTVFSTLPESARLWIFGACGSISAQNSAKLLGEIATFLKDWKAHGKSVIGEAGLFCDCFLVVAADSELTEVSGCSIDSMVNAVSGAARTVGITLSDGSHVYYRDGECVRCVLPHEFESLVVNGVVNHDTPVFNNNIQTVGEFRDGKWEVPFRDSWHAQVFRC